MQFAFEVFDQQEERLSQRLLQFLLTKPSVTIIGERDYSREKRVCTIAFVVKGMHSHAINEQIHTHNIGIKTGDFYAKGIIKALQLENKGGVVRVSMAHYNSLKELEKLIALLDKII
jgi:selenocysteine lyase/cysteine desulfurase